MPGGASWILASLSSDQRARASGSPSGFLALIVRLVIELIMSCTLPYWREPVKACYVNLPHRRGLPAAGVTLIGLFPRERYPRPMAAKNKNSHASPPMSREDLDLQDLLGLHFQASRRMEEVLEQVEELRLAGRFAEARTLQMHAKGIQQGLHALEAEVRMSTHPQRASGPGKTTI